MLHLAVAAVVASSVHTVFRSRALCHRLVASLVAAVVVPTLRSRTLSRYLAADTAVVPAGMAVAAVVPQPHVFR